MVFPHEKPLCFLSPFLLCLYKQGKLERLVIEKLCQSIVYEALQGVRTPERPSSPMDLYITEEQEFLRKNPKVRR